ncbi:hypothetical protein IFM89_013985 [Coptis chinensis]|uniref:alpha-1,2-Mannosidase n=1 Tax=Coptis chinensis TaxID=261450 RepID=A0A835IMT2_9MAGN|nr:hypothetical protein IFM89_013985 [Coptis chinensis]
MSKGGLPYSIKDVDYDNAKFRPRSFFKVMTHLLLKTSIRNDCFKCSTGKLLALLMIGGLAYLMLTHTSTLPSDKATIYGGGVQGFRKFFRKPPRLPPRLSPDETVSNQNSSSLDREKYKLKWTDRQHKVKQAFIHAWSGYKKYAMGYDELMPLSQRGTDGLGGLGATVVDALDTAIIMGVDDVVLDAGTWIEKHLLERITVKGQVNLFETSIRVLGGLLSAYHLSGGEHGVDGVKVHGPKPSVYLDIAKNLADRLLSAFTASPTSIPFSDVVLRDSSGHPAPDGLSSTAEVSSVQLEFNYLSSVSNDSKYGVEAMKVFEHIRSLPKVEGLVPIYINPQSGEFSGQNIRLGSRGDSYYEYLLKVWLQRGRSQDSDFHYLREMYEEAMKGVRNLLVRKSVPNGLVFIGELPYGSESTLSPKMDHLVCFLPGTLALGATKGITKKQAMKDNLLSFEDLENLKLAEDLTKTCFEMYSVTSTGLAPEIAYFKVEVRKLIDNIIDVDHPVIRVFMIPNWYIILKNLWLPAAYLFTAMQLPEVKVACVESLFVLYRITEDPKYREWGWKIFEAFEKYTKVDSGGFTSLNDVTKLPPERRDKMETFFLGETLKYIYLLFSESTVLPLDKFVFNTEAHPFHSIELLKRSRYLCNWVGGI